MDIVKRLDFAHLKASFQTLGLKQKFFLMTFLLSLLLNLIPHETYALEIKPKTQPSPVLVFDISDKALDYLDSINLSQTAKHTQEQGRQEALRQGTLTAKVKAYLQEKNSPLADYASTLTSVKNWKKIIALANAESSLCRNYPKALANCWGVGGSDMWDMGNSLGDGILGMNQFLTKNPLRSQVKYSQMSFERMNGLYKQPAKDHWLYNVQSVYDELSAIEKSI